MSGSKLSWLVLVMLLALLMTSAGGSMLIMPGRSYKGVLPALGAEEATLRDRLRDHVYHLSVDIGERNTFNYPALSLAANYIRKGFRDAGLPVHDESYQLGGKEMANIVAEVKGGSRAAEIVVVGAHYDSVSGSPGANDNASGVAALLELARLFENFHPERTLRLAAFVNEEPPYFQTERMGSLVYARRARERGDQIVAMLSIETIGYYSDRRKSQQYPPPLSSFYPDTGNFIGFVSDLGSAKLLRRTIGAFRKSARFPSEGVAAPAAIPGIGWSDQWSFWQTGYRGVMVTDTAPFRYPSYHDESDTPEKLDYDRMARVVSGLGQVVTDLTRK